MNFGMKLLIYIHDRSVEIWSTARHVQWNWR